MAIELNESILAAALEGFEAQLAKLEDKISFVKAQLSGKKPAKVAVASVAGPARKAAKAKGKNARAVSEEGRRRMAEAQKRRWAKVRATKGK